MLTSAGTDCERFISDPPIFEILQPVLHLREGQNYTFLAFASSIMSVSLITLLAVHTVALVHGMATVSGPHAITTHKATRSDNPCGCLVQGWSVGGGVARAVCNRDANIGS